MTRSHHATMTTRIGPVMPPPDGACGMPPKVLQTLPGYGPDVEKNRVEARKVTEKLGYWPDKRLAIKLSTRNFPGLAEFRRCSSFRT